MGNRRKRLRVYESGYLLTYRDLLKCHSFRGTVVEPIDFVQMVLGREPFERSQRAYRLRFLDCKRTSEAGKDSYSRLGLSRLVATNALAFSDRLSGRIVV